MSGESHGLLAPFGSDAYSQDVFFGLDVLGVVASSKHSPDSSDQFRLFPKPCESCKLIYTSLGRSLLQTINDLHWLVCVSIFSWSQVASCCEFIALLKVRRSLLMPASWHLQRLPKKGFHHQHSQIWPPNVAIFALDTCPNFLFQMYCIQVMLSRAPITHHTGCMHPEITTTLCRLKMSFTDSATR